MELEEPTEPTLLFMALLQIQDAVNSYCDLGFENLTDARLSDYLRSFLDSNMKRDRVSAVDQFYFAICTQGFHKLLFHSLSTP